MLQNTSSEAFALAAGQGTSAANDQSETGSQATAQSKRSSLSHAEERIESVVAGVNRLSEKSVAGMASLSEKFVAHMQALTKTGQGISEQTVKTVQRLGSRIEEAAQFQQWEQGTKERFPETLASMERNVDAIEKAAPLTALGLVQETETEVTSKRVVVGGAVCTAASPDSPGATQIGRQQEEADSRTSQQEQVCTTAVAQVRTGADQQH